MPGRWLVANAVWLQAGWWICVLGAERPWLLLLVIAGVVAFCAAGYFLAQ